MQYVSNDIGSTRKISAPTGFQGSANNRLIHARLIATESRKGKEGRKERTNRSEDRGLTNEPESISDLIYPIAVNVGVFYRTYRLSEHTLQALYFSVLYPFCVCSVTR